MAFATKRGWRDWFHEAFVRQGLFSLHPLPINQAEEREAAEKGVSETSITRLNLDAEPTPSDKP